MKPWTSGPRELLQHAKGHLDKASPFDCRIAFISVDNAVELVIKTFLGLPKRVRKSGGPTRKKLQDASNIFPDLLDLLEEHSEEKLDGIDLGDIEWYHRLRNTLYHEGNGVTVGQDKVDSYYQIAIILFENLFDEKLNEGLRSEPKSAVGKIVISSAELEHKIRILYLKHFPEDSTKKVSSIKAMKKLVEVGVIPEVDAEKILELTSIRNEAVHTTDKIDTIKVNKASEVLWEIVKKLTGLV